MKIPFEAKLGFTELFSLLAVAISCLALVYRIDTQQTTTLREQQRTLYGSYKLGIDFRSIWVDFQGKVKYDEPQVTFTKRFKTLQPIAVNVGIMIPSDAFSVEDIREAQEQNGSPEAVVSEALSTKFTDSNELQAFLLGENLELLSFYSKSGTKSCCAGLEKVTNKANSELDSLKTSGLVKSCMRLPDLTSLSPPAANEKVGNLRYCLQDEWRPEAASHSTDAPAPEAKASSRLSARGGNLSG